MYQHILLPTDGSALTGKILADAVALAKLCGARLTAVHVYPSFQFHPDGGYPPAGVRSRQELIELMKTQAQEFLDRIGAEARKAGVAFEGIAVQDDQVWRGIIDTATRLGCDMIAMAAHGRRGLAAVVLGSETNKVLTHSKIPVLVYR